ncbi:MAG: tRNA uridine-5-carboxymethylaminomethyl(34) synthesis enzyme MnmG, partial [Phycisphaerales bacterium]
AIDEAAIQFRMLNRSKGPAVWAPRAQADRAAYSRALLGLLERARSIDIIEGSAEEVLVDEGRGEDTPRDTDRLESRSEGRSQMNGDRQGECSYSEADRERRRSYSEENLHGGRSRGQCVRGVRLGDGRVLHAAAVILTTGTFLRGLMHCGPKKTEGGRLGERAAVGLSASLSALGFEVGRLKTGTPPRVHRDSIDYDACQAQPGDEIPTPFSFMNDAIHRPQVDCWITYTNEQAHKHILANLDRAPLYSGQISSTGPRYCPSIEDKVVRFSDKPRHQVFLEPEGYDNERVYCNGISTSLPVDVQQAMVHSIPALERAEILQYGYAIEYDWVPTHQTQCTLESKLVRGLFFAGQINGTSGYEEAGAQGLVAAVNAVHSMNGKEPLILGREVAYIGVLIDDLITKPPVEPYRMFTSRAEYRLQLRSDNADQRLTAIGRELGLVDDQRWQRFERKMAALEVIRGVCDRGAIDGVPLSTWMRRPEATVARFAEGPGVQDAGPFGADDLWQVLVDAKYSGYLTRQSLQIQRLRRLESLEIPDRLDYARIPELRLEAQERLARLAPRTLGQASRISGINPADITVLWVHITGRGRLRSAS